jgi:riboflavin kinase/FMN adenylyltransferase
MNLPWEPDCLPCFGVYFVRFRSDGGDWLPGVANYGIKPTVVKNGSPLLEVHALKGNGFEPGQAIEVEWLRFLRREQTFASLEALKKQIAFDVETAGGFLCDG